MVSWSNSNYVVLCCHSKDSDSQLMNEDDISLCQTLRRFGGLRGVEPAGIVSSAAFEELLPAAAKLQQLQVGASAALWSFAAEDLESQTVQGPGETLHARHLTNACGRCILEPMH